jgi:hypothetical protein
VIKNKRLIIPIYYINDNAFEKADYVVIELDECLRSRIKSLSASRDQLVHEITEHNYACTFMNTDWHAKPINGKVALKQFGGQMHGVTLNVTADGFFWSGVSCNATRWETFHIRVDVLDKPDAFDKRESHPLHEMPAGTLIRRFNDKDLATIIKRAVTENNHLDDAQAYTHFLEDLAEVITNYFGGTVMQVRYDQWFKQWMVVTQDDENLEFDGIYENLGLSISAPREGVVQ